MDQTARKRPTSDPYELLMRIKIVRIFQLQVMI